MEYEDVLSRIDELFNYIKMVENNYQYHTNWLLAILAFVVAASGASLYILARTWFNSTVKRNRGYRKEN